MTWQPETVAGRGLNLALGLGAWTESILAIEAAARAEAFAEIRRGVEAAPVLMREMFGSGDDRTVTDLIDRAAVLALLPAVPPEWRTPRGDTVEEIVTDATGQVIERYGEALQKLAERPAGEAGT